jgi:hypothetical protein
MKKRVKHPLRSPFISPWISWTGLAAVLILAAIAQFLIIQRNNPATLLPGLLLYGLSIGVFIRNIPRPVAGETEKNISLGLWEVGFFLFILILAIGIRVYKYDFFPTGVFMDEACSGWGGLMVSHERFNILAHWKDLNSVVPTMAYMAAAWFSFLKPTQANFLFFSVTVTLLAFPFIYWTFRQLAGPRTALLTLFFLAVSRWHITYSRTGHPAGDILLYIFGSLSFWIYGLRSGKKWVFIPAALLTAGGFYSYLGFVAYPPLLALYFAREWALGHWKARKCAAAFTTAYLAALAAGWPLYRLIIARGGLGNPKDSSFFLSNNNGGFQAILHQFSQTALFFNRQGDSWLVHNLPYHRMLDDVTGVLFVLGFFLALTRLADRKYIYAVLGMAVLSLPAWLSTNPISASRMMGTLPFTGFLAACALEALGSRIQVIAPRAGSKIYALVMVAGLALAAFQNFHIYFREQAEDFDCRRWACLEETVVGNTIQNGGDAYEYYLSPRFYGHYTVLFLGFDQRAHMHPLALPEDLIPRGRPEGRGILFALEEGRTGVRELLQTLYPGGETELAKDSNGHSIVYFYRVPPRLVNQGLALAEKFTHSNFGLRGTYIQSLDWKSHPALVHRDPLLNFTFRNDFPLSQFPPLSIHWTGMMDIPSSGLYHFLALTTDSAKINVDRKTVLDQGNTESKEVFLRKGSHRINVFFQKSEGVDTVFNLLWKRPGAEKYEIIPYTAFKRTPID